MQQSDGIDDLKKLNHIAQTLNKAADVKTALDSSLAQLVQLMGLQTGWIFVYEPTAAERWAGHGFRLAAHYRLPPALELWRNEAWDKSCSCQSYCLKGELEEAYNEVRCSRLAEATGDKNDLAIHASAPLRSGTNILGILNIAADDWSTFDDRALALLTTVGAQMGIALERARLHDLLRRQRVQEQSALLTFSKELLRGSSLQSLALLIVEEARKLLNVDACALLIPDRTDESELYFRAASGWQTDPVGLRRRVPASQETQIGRVMRSQQPLAGDIEREQPFATFALWAAKEGFKAVAAAPLVVDSISIGVLVIHSRSERVFSEADLRYLQLLANQAAIALEGARLQYERLERQRMERELAVGRQIQQGMLPKEMPHIAGWELATAMEAALAVGGDFYDYFPFAADVHKWSLVIGDVSGKGVPAALYMVLSRTTIRNAAQVDRSPADVLRLTNQYILEDSQADMFLSVFYAMLDTRDGRLTYSNAGHNFPLWWRADSHMLEPLTDHGTLVGVLNDLELENNEITLSSGDVLLLYTDGVTDAINAQQEEFGTERLQAIVSSILNTRTSVAAQELVDIIVEAVEGHTGAQPQFDDVTLLVLKRKES